MTDKEKLETLWDAVPKEYLDAATKELFEAMQDILEFYLDRFNYIPEPLPDPEEITLTFDKVVPRQSSFTTQDCINWGWYDKEMDVYDTLDELDELDDSLLIDEPIPDKPIMTITGKPSHYNLPSDKEVIDNGRHLAKSNCRYSHTL